MNEKISYKGTYGTVYEDVKIISSYVKNDFTEEEYYVEAPSIASFFINSQDSPVIGDYIMTTSGEFDIDSLRGCYSPMKRDYYRTEVVARFVDFEGDSYIPEKSRNGGGYLHKWWKIEQILDQEYIE